MAGDFSDLVWLPAHPSNYRVSYRQRPTLIVIHCTDGHERAQPVAEMWREPNHGSSAHFVVGQNGEIFQSVMIKDVAWHAHSANSYSVGIEHCARTPGELGVDDPGLPPSDALYNASALLVARLCVRLGLPASRVAIVGHNEADKQTTHTECPTGCGWDWPRYMGLVMAAREKIQDVV